MNNEVPYGILECLSHEVIDQTVIAHDRRDLLRITYPDNKHSTTGFIVRVINSSNNSNSTCVDADTRKLYWYKSKDLGRAIRKFEGRGVSETEDSK